MSNVANQPYADLLAKTFPPPEDVKIFTAGADAQKMLAFWSIKQPTKSFVLRIGQALFRAVLHQCPHCKQDLSAQAVKMSVKEREMLAALSQMLKTADAGTPASKPTPKKAKQASKPSPAPVSESDADNGLHASEDELTLEQLDALTAPGGGA